MNLNEPPAITVPLSVGGYIGFALLCVLALAILIFAALLISVHTGAGLILSSIGAVIFMYAAFPYLRTVERGWDWPNIVIWGSIILSGVLASVVTYFITKRRYGYAGSTVLAPALGVAAGGVLAGILDALNEILGSIPLSWAAALVIMFIAVAWFISRE